MADTKMKKSEQETPQAAAETDEICFDKVCAEKVQIEETETVTAQSEKDTEALDEEFEYFDIEISDDEIVAYLEDEEGNTIGFVVEEEGVEVEYYYCTDDELDSLEAGSSRNNCTQPSKTKSTKDEYDLGITREGVAQATNDANAIYKDGVVIASELKGAFDDIKEAFTFKPLKK